MSKDPLVEKYLVDAQGWSRDVLDGAHRSRRRAWIVAAFATAAAISGWLAVAALAPLKRVDGYLVIADRTTGAVETITSLAKGVQNAMTLSESEAITKANLAQYVIARETFDLTDIEERHDQVRRTSERRLFDEYDRTFRGEASVNPFKLYEDHVREVEVKSVEFFNETTAQVRFRADLRKDGHAVVSHWLAILKFRYVQQPATLSERLANPLGFQVLSYRVDQEASQ